jgi:hypothetical protein
VRPVFTRPDDLSDEQVADAVRTAWGVPVEAVEWAAVGFGSHHWRITSGDSRWFATADDLVTKGRQVDATDRRLRAALTTAVALRDAGLDFVVAPLLTARGDVLHAIEDRYALALYQHVEGEPHPWGAYPSRDERLAVLELVARVHAASAAVADTAARDELAIPSRAELMAALADCDAPWTSGPYAPAARGLLRRHGPVVRRALDRYDRLTASVRRRGRPLVVTHGEPHRANTITTAEGPVLIDWETTLLAPPERDLWAMAAEDPRIPDDYRALTGTSVDDEALALYALWWELTEVCGYTAVFRAPHRASADTRQAWLGFEGYLASLANTR